MTPPQVSARLSLMLLLAAALAGVVLLALRQPSLNSIPVGGPVRAAPPGEPGGYPLTEVASTAVFGQGEGLGVTIPTKEGLRMTFQYTSIATTDLYLAFGSRGITRRDQLTISLNGKRIGGATVDSPMARIRKLKLPRRFLRRGALNEVTFVAEGGEPWAVIGPKLETRARPLEKDPRARSAETLVDLADDKLAEKESAPAARFEALVALKQAVASMEPLEAKPMLYKPSVSMLRGVEHELETLCKASLAKGKRAERDPAAALAEYAKALEFFPEGPDVHPCRAQLQERIQALRN